MTFTVSVQGKDIKFPCEPNETVLDAAQRAGYELPYSCRKGVCGTCKGQIVSGEVRAYAGDALSAAEQAERQVLYCQTRPRSDLEIAPRSIEKTDPFARRTLTARVFRMKRLADDVMLLHLRYPAGERVRFKAGQYVSILWGENEENRDFSMANPPSESDGAQLHVRLVQDGSFTTHVFEKMKVGDHLRVKVPLGSFILRESDKPILFVAGGTGFAPMQSMIEDMAAKGIQRDVTLYWGARQKSGLYSDLPEKWAAQNPRFRYIPVISDVVEPGFRHGLVHQAVLEDHPSLADFQAYVCGVPALCRAARKDFRAAGLPVREFFIDTFTTKADVAAARPQ
jgi:NAD(P)H-flavin reductase/ferredoxin